MVTLQSVPPNLVFGKNPIWYKLSTDQFIVAGTHPYWELTMDANGPQSLDFFEIEILDSTIRIDFISPLNVPANTFEVVGNDDANLMGVYGTGLVEALQKNHALSAHFTITLESSSDTQAVIRLTSRYGVEFVGTENMSNTTATYTAGTDDTYADHYKILVQVWMESGYGLGDYRLIDTLEQTPDANQAAVFNLMKQVKAQLRHELPEYLDSSAKIVPCTRPLGRFYLQYADKSGTPVVQNDWSIELATHTAYLAGVAEDQHPNADLNVDWVVNARAFTHQPAQCLVAPDELVYLYFVPSSQPNGVDLEVVVYFEDGSSMSYSPTVTVTVPDRYQMAWASVGYNQLAIGSADPAKTVHHYTVRVKSTGGTYYTDLRTYVVDHHYHAQQRQLLLANGMGGYDSLLVTGTQQAQVNRPHEVVEQPARFNASPADATQVAVREDGHKVMEVSAGPYDNSYARYVEDLLLQHGQAYLVDGGHFTPIIITSTSVDMVNEDDDVQQIRIQYRYGFDQVNWKE